MKAWQLIEQGWTQGVLARDELGHKVWPTNPDANCWCLLGSMAKCYPQGFTLDDPHDKIRARINSTNIANWNDAPERTKSEVVAVLKELDL